MTFTKSIAAFLFLLALCVFAYWDIATFQDTLKWDMLDCYYPWRYFVGESIQHRVFPLWNPYQHLGYPIHADMRSVFYPETFLVGLLGGYNLYVLHGLFIFYITLAGTGFYRLAAFFVKNNVVKLTVASAYLLSGFFVGHGQELSSIIAACWIPWVLVYFIRFQRLLLWADLWKLAFFLFLQLTGGYQALSLILFYLLFVIFCIELNKNYQRFRWQSVFHNFKINAILVTLILLSLSVLIVVYLQVSPEVQRLGGVTLQQAFLNAVTPAALLSFVLPFSVISDSDILLTDISMANMYVGITLLAFAIVGLFKRKSLMLKAFAFFGLFCLLASMGKHTPVREFLYHFVPGLNLFRMSSFFSYFGQLAFLLLAAVALEDIIAHPRSGIKRFAAAIGVLILMVCGAMIYAYFHWPDGVLAAGQFLLSPFSQSGDISYYQRLVYQGYIQLMVLVFFFVGVFLLRRKQTALSIFILMAVVLEMSFALRLNFSATVGGGHNPTKMLHNLAAQPNGFPIPDLTVQLPFNTESKPELSPLWHNTNILTKTVSQQGFNSFQLDRFVNYEQLQQQNGNNGLKQPLLFSPQGEAKIDLTLFEPGRVESNITATKKCTLVLQQTFYPGWEVTLNGVAQEMILYQDIFSSVIIPAGKSTVTFEYRNKPVLVAFGVSYGVFFVIILACIFYLAQSYGKFNLRKSAAVSVTILFCGLGFLILKWTQTQTMQQKRTAEYQLLANLLQNHVSGNNVGVLFQVDLPTSMDSILRQSNINVPTNYLASLHKSGYTNFSNSLKNDSFEKRIYVGSNLKEDRLVIELLHQHYPTLNSYKYGRTYIHVFERSGKRVSLFSSSTDLETENENWNYRKDGFDKAAKALSGKLGWRIFEKQLGSPPISVRVGDITEQKQLNIVFGLHCLINSKKPNGAAMYIEIRREGNTIWSKAANINAFATDAENWFGVTHIAQPEMELQPDDVIRAFVWGSTGNPIHLDDFWLNIYPRNLTQNGDPE